MALSMGKGSAAPRRLPRVRQPGTNVIKLFRLNRWLYTIQLYFGAFNQLETSNWLESCIKIKPDILSPSVMVKKVL